VVSDSDIRVDEVDGVPLLWADLDGPLQAHLLFGVGQAHETLPLHGITHLVEHLVLTGSADSPHAYNGTTANLTTSFVVAGGEAQVVDHLALVCRNLADLPVERLGHEKHVLRAEAAQRGGSPADPLQIWRWGPLGFGLPAYEEMALRWVGEQDARDWARRLGRENAAIWLSKAPPAGLRLPLAWTVRRPAPSPSVASSSPLPGCFPLPQRGVSFSLLLPRVPESGHALWLLHHRLERRLRHDLGLVYGVTSGTEVLDADTRHVMVRLDCLEESSERVQAETVAVLQRLTEPPSDAEWQKMLAQRALVDEAPKAQQLAHYLDSAAESLLLGRAVDPPATWQRKVDAVAPEQVASCLGACLPSLVLGVTSPEQVPAELATPIPLYSSHRVRGQVLRPSTAHTDGRVESAVVGADGATLLLHGGEAITVRTDGVAGVLCYDDGARHLLGTDGYHLWLAPEEWGAGYREAVAVLDGALPRAVRIPGGEREHRGTLEEVPAAPAPRWRWRRPAGAQRRRSEGGS
jgi:zinc protease